MSINEILEQHKLWIDTNGNQGERATLSKADLSGANLFEADLSKADLSGANLSGAYLFRANLSEADLSKADLSEADLSEADLSGANLSEADLSEANLSKADLSGADLSHIKGKEVYIYAGSKHMAYSIDGKIKIGCQEHTIEYWIENGVRIGKINNYSDKEIEQYIKWIKSFGAFEDE